MANEDYKKRLLSVLLENPNDLAAIQDLFLVYKRQGQLNFSYFELINKADRILEYYQNQFDRKNEDKIIPEKGKVTFSHRIIYPKYIFIERHNEHDASSRLKCIEFDMDAERGKISPQRMSARHFSRLDTISLHGPLEGQQSLYEIPCHTLYLKGVSNLDLDKFNRQITKLSLSYCKEVRYSKLLTSLSSPIQKLEITDSEITDITDFIEYFINTSNCDIGLTLTNHEVDLLPFLKLKEWNPKGKVFKLNLEYLCKSVKKTKKAREQLRHLISEIPDFSEKVKIPI